MVDRGRPRAPDRRPRIALGHDWLVSPRGGEAVLDRVARLALDRGGPAGLYVLFESRAAARGGAVGPPADLWPRRVSLLNVGGLGAGRPRRWLLPAYPAAVDRLSRRLARDHARAPIDLLVTTSSAAIKGLAPPPGVPHLCYCHSPARYVWSQETEYARGSPLRGLGLRAVGPSFRAWDEQTAANVTRFIANSRRTRDEVRRCYDRDAVVVHPPVRTGFYTPDPAVTREPFLLAVGALEPYKRFDLAIAACRARGAPLTIVGDGSDAGRLRRLAGAGVRFTGRINDGALRDLYRRAAALVFPQIEDFGIVAAEAQACGCPVVAFRGGGALDIVLEGLTGAFFDDPTPQALAAAIDRTPARADRACRANAERFAEPIFDAEVGRIMDEMLGLGGSTDDATDNAVIGPPHTTV